MADHHWRGARVKNQGLVEPVQPEMYLPAEQATMTVASTLMVRGVGDPLALLTEVRDQVRVIDKNIPLTFSTMTHEIDDSFRANGSIPSCCPPLPVWRCCSRPLESTA